MNLLCKMGLHLLYMLGTEDGTGIHANEFRMYKSCDCGKKKQYQYDGQWATDNDLLGHGSSK